MTPQPPSSSDGQPLPPRHRPNMSSLAKDTSESELWAFDDEDAPASAAPIPSVPRDQSSKDTPAQRAARPKPENKPGESRTPVEPGAQPVSKRKAAPDPAFEDLDAWDETLREIDDEPVLKLTPETPKTTPPSKPAPPPVAAEKPAPERKPTDERDEFTPVPRADAVPVTMPKLGLTRVERIGLGALIAILSVGAIFLFTNSLSLLPKGSALVDKSDFPIKGERVIVESAESFWREPVRDGPKADSFRRGTELLPAVDLSAEGGPAALRVFFRNAQGDLIGDPVTRAVGANTSAIPVAASAGFDDIGMHAAYRAGDSKPWTIEVHEGPSVDAPSQNFKKLFEMTVSPDRR